MPDAEDSDKGISTARESLSKSQNNAREHVKQLQRLQEKDPEFYQYLKEHDNELLEFNDEDISNDAGSVLQDDMDSKPTTEELQKPLAIVITTTKVDSWCSAIKQQRSLGAVKSMLHAFRLACHHGDDAEDGSGKKIAILSSSVFNKIMVFVLNEMDEILRKLLGAPSSGGKKESILDLMTTKKWKSRGSLMRLYLGNTLHILTEMTDEQMISFTLKRIKASAVFLAAFPILLRKYIKVVLHAWGTGIGALPVVSFLFLRDLCVQLGSDCLERCLKGVYKAYVMNCKLPKHISRSKQQHINFLGNCVSELYGLDPISAYQHAFVSIRQLAVVLRGSINERGSKTVKGKGKGKIQQGSSKASKKQAEKTYQKVYDWQFIFCLELWTKVICAFNSEAYFGPLAYPLTQIISGVAIFVPTARYCPLRLRCIRMLNRLAGATSTFIPVSTLLLDMLDMKELNGPPTGGVGKAIDLHGIKQLDKITLKTRAFQEACIYSVVQELAEHLAQWSYSIAFFELSFISLVRLRNCCKSIKGDRFRREIRELISQVEANCEFTNLRRIGICFGPSDPAASSFLEAEKESKSSPLMEFVANLSLRVQQRAGSIAESRVLVGAESSVFSSKFSEMDQEESGDLQEEGEAVFNSSWMPEKKSKATKSKLKTLKHDKKEPNAEAVEEDVVEDLILSSDEGEDEDDIDNGGDNDIHSNDDGVALIDPTDESKEDLESHQSKTRQSKKRKIRQVRTHNNKKEKSRANLKKGAWLPKTTVRNGPN